MSAEDRYILGRRSLLVVAVVSELPARMGIREVKLLGHRSLRGDMLSDWPPF